MAAATAQPVRAFAGGLAAIVLALTAACSRSDEPEPAILIVNGAPDTVAGFVADARIRYPETPVEHEPGRGSATFRITDANTGVDLAEAATAARLTYAMQLRD